MMDDDGNIYRNAGTPPSFFFGNNPWVSGEDFPKKTNPLSKKSLNQTLTGWWSVWNMNFIFP
jgi:hypothetical protein